MRVGICIVLTAIAGFAARAEVAVTNGYTWTYRILNGKAIITDFMPEPSGRFVIPASLDGYPVEEIGIYDNNLAYPFSYAKGSAHERDYYACHEIVVSEGIQRIGDKCFSRVVGEVLNSEGRFEHASVTNIVLPTSLKVIGNEAFLGLLNLTELRFPEGVSTIPISALPITYYGAFGVLGARVTCPESFSGWICGHDSYLNSYTLSSYAVTYLGNPPTGEALEVALSCGGWKVPPCCFDKWMQAIALHGNIWWGQEYASDGGCPALANFNGVLAREVPAPAVSVSILSGGFRKGNPRVYDLVYRVNTTASTARVQAVGVIESCEGSSGRYYDRWGYANTDRCSVYVVTGYIRPANWIDGSSENLGNSVAANVPHKLSWQISDTEREKIVGTKVRLSVRVLARTGELLPVHVVTLPSSIKIGTTSSVEYNGYANFYCDQEYMTGVPEMKVSLDAFTQQQLQNAILFAYAEGDESVNPPVYDSQLGYVGFDAAAARSYIAKKCGFKLLSEVESFSTNYSCKTWWSFREDRADRWCYATSEATYTVDQESISSRLNAALFHSRALLNLGFDPWVKFD